MSTTTTRRRAPCRGGSTAPAWPTRTSRWRPRRPRRRRPRRSTRRRRSGRRPRRPGRRLALIAAIAVGELVARLAGEAGAEQRVDDQRPQPASASASQRLGLVAGRRSRLVARRPFAASPDGASTRTSRPARAAGAPPRSRRRRCCRGRRRPRPARRERPRSASRARPSPARSIRSSDGDAALLDRPAIGLPHLARRRAAASSQGGKRHRTTATAPAVVPVWVSESSTSTPSSASDRRAAARAARRPSTRPRCPASSTPRAPAPWRPPPWRRSAPRGAGRVRLAPARRRARRR